MWHLTGEPYTVQTAAQNAANGRRGFGYFLEQGLGKTSLTFNEYIELKNQERVDYLIVVCMYSKMDDWKEDALEWTDGALDLSIWPDTEGEDGVILNYEILLYSGGEWLEQFLKDYRCYLTYDESSRIKNPNGATSKWALEFSSDAEFVRLLNGTPMTQSVMDLYPQLRAIGELEGVNRYAFRNRWAQMGGFMGKKVIGAKDPEGLAQMLARFSFRALKTDWSDIPDKTYALQRVRMTNKQEDLYQQMLHDFWLELDGGEEVSAEYVITQAEKLQQISSGFVIDEDREVHDLMPPNRNPKLTAVREYLEIAPGKTIIGALHKRAVDLLVENLPGNPAVIRGKGDMKRMGRTIKEEKRRFNEDPNCREIVLQIQSGAFGHTLLGGDGEDHCAATVHFENSYSLLLRSQIEDRNHRFGQHLSAYHLDLVASPIEAKVVEALKSKKRLASAIVDAVRATFSS
ncbi:hypothetical protein LCGC14_0626100 [marine sediment metagenome]|uniref:SNF2 N-terminal domain-containing protein n=1 Tax=marine sediment metagenome TaxID=412755 RepID=A0A0F9R3C4_9ZZZZ